MPQSAFQEFRNGDSVELLITEPITEVTAQRIISQLSVLKGQSVTITLFSGGGDLVAAYAIYDYLTDAQNALDSEVRVYGNAASAAMVIAAGAKRRYIGESSMMLIHNGFLAEGEPDDKLKVVIDGMNDRQVEIFSAITGKRKDRIAKLMSENRFIMPDEAVELGFFDGTIAQAKLAALLTNKTMSEQKQVRTFKVSAADALKAIASGTIEVPEAEIASAEADKVKALDEQIANLTKERDELKAAKDAAETAKAEAEAKVTEVTATVTASADLAAKFKAEVDTLKAEVEALKKTPLRAQTLPDGTQVVTPGSNAPVKPGPVLTKKDEHIAEANALFEEAKARIWKRNNA